MLLNLIYKSLPYPDMAYVVIRGNCISSRTVKGRAGRINTYTQFLRANEIMVEILCVNKHVNNKYVCNESCFFLFFWKRLFLTEKISDLGMVDHILLFKFHFGLAIVPARYIFSKNCLTWVQLPISQKNKINMLQT